MLCYGASFGVELTVNNMMAQYFRTHFGLSMQMAGNIAALFGLMNLFARAIGGFLSDGMQKRHGMRGRLYALTLCLFGEAVLLCVFSRMKSLAGSIFFLVCFSVFVQASEGATFGVVPYVSPKLTGAISGMVGAGGNIGAILWGLVFRLSGLNTPDCLFVVSFCVLVVCGLSVLVQIEGHEGILKRSVPLDTDLAGKKLYGMDDSSPGGALAGRWGPPVEVPPETPQNNPLGGDGADKGANEENKA